MTSPPPPGSSTKRWAVVAACAAIAAVVLLAVLLTRGGGQETTSPSTDVGWDGGSSDSGNGDSGNDGSGGWMSSDDEEYLAMLEGEGLMATDAKLIELGLGICDALDSGVSGVQLVQVARESGLTSDQGTMLVVAAVVAYCPWNQDAATS